MFFKSPSASKLSESGPTLGHSNCARTSHILAGGYFQALMLNDRVSSVEKLRPALQKAEQYLAKLPEDTPSIDLATR